ncbi:AAA family ATPase [Bradyrhizobium sp. dw_411]|uniref:AAA family ATPase n=1 Tax=Bradyrhizobium sp. dw_411 TaxID=2720082 RepID=UPI001BCC618C|nr:AAA family ATPase [Bradyrhizobium sp. dw_411]
MVSPANLAMARRVFADLGYTSAPQDDGPPDDGYEGPIELPESADTEPHDVSLATETSPRKTSEEKSKTLHPTAFRLRDPATIPPRDSLYGNHYMRGYVSGTVAPGGLGKSSLALLEATAMCSARSLLGYPVRQPLRVWYWGGEDPVEETERRLGAIRLHYDIRDEEIDGRLFCDSGRDMSIRIAAMVRQQAVVDDKLVDEIIAALKSVDADVMIVDPFVASHGLPENDNTATDWMMKRGWVRIAAEANVAVDLVHHVRKNGGQGDTTVEDARGASATLAALRSARVLNIMSPEDARTAAVPADERWRHFNVQVGKANMSPRTGKPKWYRLASVSLGNGTETRPEDYVGVVTAWTMPGALDDVQVGDLVKVQESIRDGAWGSSRQAGDWAGYAIGQALDINTGTDDGKAKVNSMLSAWLKSGALREESRHDHKKGRARPFIVVGVQS